MRTSNHAARIGGLALAVGLGVAVTTGQAVAGAEVPDSARSDSASSEKRSGVPSGPDDSATAGNDDQADADQSDQDDQDGQDGQDGQDDQADEDGQDDQDDQADEADEADEEEEADEADEEEEADEGDATGDADADDEGDEADERGSATGQDSTPRPVVETEEVATRVDIEATPAGGPVIDSSQSGASTEQSSMQLAEHAEAQAFSSVVGEVDTAAVTTEDTTADPLPVARTPVGLFTGVLAFLGLKPGPVGSPVTPWTRLVEFIWVATRRVEYTLFNFSPRATETVYTVAPGTGMVTGVIGAIDPDPEDTLRYSVLTDPEFGVLELDSDGEFTYTPDPAAGSPQIVRFAVQVDEIAAYPHLHLLSWTGPTITIDVELRIDNVNSAPTLAVGRSEPGADGSVTFTAVPTDVDGDAVLIQPDYDAAVGTLTEIEERVYRWIPSPDYAHGLTEPVETSVGFTAVDEFGAASAAVVLSVLVEPQNSLPVVAVDASELDAEGRAVIDLQYTDADGDGVRVLGEAAEHGSYVQVTVLDASGEVVEVIAAPVTLDFLLRDGDRASIVYQAVPGDTDLTEVITFAVDDGHGGITDAALSIDIPAADTDEVLTFPGFNRGSVLVDAVGSGRIYVVSDRTLYVVDPATGTTLNTMDLGAVPASVVVSPDGRHAYVARFSSDVIPVLKVDLETGEIVEIGGARQAGSMAVSPDGSTLYVVGNQASEIYAINTETGAFAVPFYAGSQSFGEPSVAVSADGATLYVGMLTNDLAIITIATGAVTSVDLGETPPSLVGTQSIAVDADRVYVTDKVNGSLVVVDATTRAVIATIDVGGAPTAVAYAPDREFVFVAGGDRDIVSVIRPGAGEVALTVPVSGGVGDLDVSGDGELLFVTTAAGVQILEMAEIRALAEAAEAASTV